MQPAAAAQIQPAISLLGKTPQLRETLLGVLSGEASMKYVHLQP